MPGFTTHYLFGTKTLRQLKRSDSNLQLLQSIDKHKTVFQLGLQGPDIFFYHPASQLRKVKPGSATHTKWTSDFLKCLIQAHRLFRRENDRQTAQAYAAGFIGHYILDTQIHPYVYYLTGIGNELKKKGYANHIALESDIDTCMLMRYTGHLPSAFPHGKTIVFDAHTRSVVAKVLQYAYHTIFPEFTMRKGYFKRAILSMQLGTQMTYNPHNRKRLLLEKAENILLGQPAISPVIPMDDLVHEDPLNLKHKQWRNPWNPNCISSESIPELMQHAFKRYHRVLLQLNQLDQTEPSNPQYAIILAQITHLLGQQSYHSGLDWTLGE